MFTGIVEEVGAVQAIHHAGRSAHLTVVAPTILKDLKAGDSLAVDGVCLTVASRTDHEATLDLSVETLRVTTLGLLKAGDGVNLERPLRIGDPLGGHFVMGHVDGVGTILSRRQEEDTLFLTIGAPPEVLHYSIRKGSIAVDGISLTINEMDDRSFRVAVIPHTVKATTLGLKGVGAAVNLECDLLGKYIERLLLGRGAVLAIPGQPPSRRNKTGGPWERKST
jgi:riboflavin synthase